MSAAVVSDTVRHPASRLRNALPGGWSVVHSSLAGVSLVIAALAWLRLISHPIARAASMCASRTSSEGAEWTALLECSLVMSCAMMLPVVTPALLHFLRDRYARSRRAAPPVAAVLFVLVYLGVWTIAGAVVSAAGASLHIADGMSPDTALAARAGWCALAFLTGCYQLSRVKLRLLASCAGSSACAATPADDGERTVLGAGLRHGVACVGCCGPIMLVGATLAPMSAAAMGVTTLWIALERAPGLGPSIARLSGAALLAIGLAGLPALVG